MQISSDLMQAYKTRNSSGLDIQVTVLTSTFWPTVPANSVQFPLSISSLCDSFKGFYNSRHTGRKLTFLNHLGTGDIICRFDSCKREANVSTLAMIVLLSFNDAASQTLAQLTEATGIQAQELTRTLVSLSQGKYKLLIKLGDTYSVNGAFTSSLQKIKITPVSVSAQDSIPQITMQRKHQIEACIIRTMKSRKKIEHVLLVTEVISQLERLFMPDPVQIKERIEGLIEREYIERDGGSRTLYHYVA
jgi:cullin 3